MSTPAGPMSRQDRLARLKAMQEGYSKIKTGYDSGFLRLDQGSTTVRILPPVGDMNDLFYHQQVGYHMIGNNAVRCSEFTTNYEVKCPICEVNEVLRRSGAKDLANKIRLSKKYWINVIVRENGDNFDTADGPYILSAGVTIFNRTRSFVSDPDYGLIDDPEAGIDLKIDKTGEGLATEYQVNPRRGSFQPLIAKGDGVDWETVQQILDAAQDLSPVLMPDNPDTDEEFLAELGRDAAVKVFGYDRTVAQYGVHLDTIHELPDIIAANSGQGNPREETDGGYARPQRGSARSNNTNAAGSGADAIKSRIAALRGGMPNK